MKKEDLVTDLDFDLDPDLEFVDLEDTIQTTEENYARHYNDSENNPDDEYDYDDDDEDDDFEDIDGKKHHKPSFSTIMLLIILVIIVGLLAVILIIIRKPNYVPVNPDNGVDLVKESFDAYKRFVPTEAEGYIDDGELNIMILADESIGRPDDENGIPNIIQNTTGANVYTCILPGGLVTPSVPHFTKEANPKDLFCLYSQVSQICAGSDGSYDEMLSAVNEYMAGDADAQKYYAYWDLLHPVPFKKADIIIVCYGMNDYLNASKFNGSEEAIGVFTDIREDGFETALDSSLNSLKTRFPYAQILAVTPYDFMVSNENGELVDASRYNTGVSNLGEYVTYIATYAEKNNITLVDNYLGTDMEPDNIEKYLEEDGVTLTDEAKNLLANHIMEFFYFNYNEKHSLNN